MPGEGRAGDAFDGDELARATIGDEGVPAGEVPALVAAAVTAGATPLLGAGALGATRAGPAGGGSVGGARSSAAADEPTASAAAIVWRAASGSAAARRLIVVHGSTVPSEATAAAGADDAAPGTAARAGRTAIPAGRPGTAGTRRTVERRSGAAAASAASGAAAFGGTSPATDVAAATAGAFAAPAGDDVTAIAEPGRPAWDATFDGVTLDDETLDGVELDRVGVTFDGVTFDGLTVVAAGVGAVEGRAGEPVGEITGARDAATVEAFVDGDTGAAAATATGTVPARTSAGMPGVAVSVGGVVARRIEPGCRARPAWSRRTPRAGATRDTTTGATTAAGSRGVRDTSATTAAAAKRFGAAATPLTLGSPPRHEDSPAPRRATSTVAPGAWRRALAGVAAPRFGVVAPPESVVVVPELAVDAPGLEVLAKRPAGLRSAAGLRRTVPRRPPPPEGPGPSSSPSPSTCDSAAACPAAAAHIAWRLPNVEVASIAGATTPAVGGRKSLAGVFA